MGEVRQMFGAGDAALRLRRMLFFKACARMSTAVAYAAAGRILGYVGPGTLHPFARQGHSGWNRYNASDPSFTDVISLMSQGSGCSVDPVVCVLSPPTV